VIDIIHQTFNFLIPTESSNKLSAYCLSRQVSILHNSATTKSPSSIVGVCTYKFYLLSLFADSSPNDKA